MKTSRRLAGAVYIGFFSVWHTLFSSSVSETRSALLFRVPQAEQVALSPDGRHVAFTQHNGSELTIVVMNVERSQKTATFNVEEGRSLEFSKEKTPPRLRFLKWATANRLVFAPTTKTIPAPPVPDYVNGGTMPNPGGPHIIAPIFAADADGKNAKQLVDARDFEVFLDPGPLREIRDDGRPPDPMLKRSRPPEIIGFDDQNSSQLLIETKGFRYRSIVTPTEVHRVDVFSGKIKYVGSDSPAGSYLYDKQGRARVFIPRPVNSASDELQYAASDGARRWKPLRSALPSWDQSAFSSSPITLFDGRATVLSFDYEKDTIYMGAYRDRDTYTVFASQIGSSAPPRIAIAHDSLDLGVVAHSGGEQMIIFDEHKRRLVGARTAAGPRSAVWIDDELKAFQTASNSHFPGSKVDILDWNHERTRFLLKVSSGANPGRLFVYFRQETRMREVTRSAPWLDEDSLHPTRSFTIEPRAGTRLTGFITFPRSRKVKAAPLVIKFAPGIPAIPHPTYDAEAQVLADMGCVVVRLNQRGTQGFGRRFRDDLTGGVEEAAAQDARSVAAWVAGHTAIDGKRVALIGEGFGGFLALKAVQLYPDAFRCAVTFDAPIVPGAWLPDIADRNVQRQARRARLARSNPSIEELSLLHAGPPLSRPTFLAVNSVKDGNIAADTRALQSRIAATGAAAMVVEIQDDFALGLPMARARVYRQVEEFINLHLYDYSVQVGETTPVR